MTEISKQTGSFESFDGTKIYYESRGKGRPIILCYGLACVTNHWIHQINDFSKRYRVVVFDYRGHHQSEAPRNRENLTLDAICQDIRCMMDHLEIEHASFWGHSYGVQLLLRFYDMHPASVKTLVFINGFATNPIVGMFGIDFIPTIFQLFKEGYKNLPETFAMLWKMAVLNPLAIPLSSLAGGFNLQLTSLKDIEVYARGVASMDLDVFIALFEQMMNYDGLPVLERIDVPTLIISGNKDGVTPMSHQEKMHQKIRSSQLTVVPYGSHCTQLDLPDFVNLRIEKFLREAK